jgi:hypothetical protein
LLFIKAQKFSSSEMQRRGDVEHIKAAIALGPGVLRGQAFGDAKNVGPINWQGLRAKQAI